VKCVWGHTFFGETYITVTPVSNYLSIESRKSFTKLLVVPETKQKKNVEMRQHTPLITSKSGDMIAGRLSYESDKTAIKSAALTQ